VGSADTPDAVTVGPAPLWIDRISVPADDAATPQLNEGVRFLLIDYQLAHEPVDVEMFSHVAKKIVSQEGVQQGAELAFEVVPPYQQLILHSLQIHRGTNVLDRLSRDNIKVIQRERDLARRIYDGTLSAIVFLEDVRAGDVIEYSWTVRGANPVFGDRYVGALLTQWPFPIGRRRVRIWWPSKRPLHVKPYGATGAPAVDRLSDHVQYLWDQTNTPAVNLEGDLPTWYQPFGWLQLSEFDSWNEVARWATQLNTRTDPLSPALQQKVTEWRGQSSDKERQLLAALQFVQDDVRYLGIELGASSHAPADPNLVADRRFGDCKDKALLLCSLLHALGIEAHPALVNSSMGSTIDDWLPSPLCFDHTIVQVTLDGASYWIDPTRSHQRGRLSELYVPDYRWALVVKKDTAILSHVGSPTLAAPIMQVYEHYDARSFTNPASLHIVTTRYGSEAEQMRYYCAQTTQEQLDKNLANYHAQWFPQLSLQGHVQVSDDTDHNVLKTTQDYLVPGYWSLTDDKRLWVRDLSPWSVLAHLRKPGTIQRTMPLGIEYPVHVVHTTEVMLPSNCNVKSTNIVAATKSMRLNYTRKYTGRVLQLRYEYDALTDSVPVEDMADYLKTLGQMDHLLSMHLSMPVNATASSGAESALSGGLNWQLALITVLFISLLAGAAVWVYRYQPSAPPLPPGDGEAGLHGIGGWLIFPAIGIVVSPIVIVLQAMKLHFIFSVDRWNALTSKASEAYHPLWGPLLTAEWLTNIFLVIYSILVAVLFFQRRRLAVTLCIVLLILRPLVVIVDYAAIQQIPAVAARHNSTAGPDIARGIIAAFIWVSYFRMSRRVKATFTR
jgi:hypothetical protein